ncbi:hypothetical protein M408DRAFT_325449 [Serendipita vermifera MAFF 305830]|uniref:Deacetylase sirtuin-type domain-containing protein n=1 Tax=Serendipita vermifera MAFF 305830 TaxID=933852 RepID=A0A0C3BQZ4_SERVB|nr:hypothetical protein M408DRAFT_325449 [Serendipita vermifera MAFF 305830]
MPITTLNIEEDATDVTVRRALTGLSSAVVKSRRIVVVTGAGISCSCGIPDFRSSDGLYNLVKQQYPDVVLKGRDLFDASLFRDKTSTAVFYTFISGLKAAIDKASPSPTHHFLHTLHKRGKLLRSYTQNIDGLEERSGLSGTGSVPNAPADASNSKTDKPKIAKDAKNIQLHGDIHRVRCNVCSASFPCEEEHMEIFQKGTAPDCPECKQRSDERVARSARAVRVGTLRPAIVLYDEPHPLGDDIAAIQTSDLSKRPDLLIIMGTSLKVHGLKKLVKEFAKAVHHGSTTPSATAPPKVIFVNKTAPAAEWAGVIDLHVQGTSDAWVERVISDWKHSKPTDWETQPTLKEVLATTNTKPKVTTQAGKTSKPKVAPKRNDSNAENVSPSAAAKAASSAPVKRQPLGSATPSQSSQPIKGRVLSSATSVKAPKVKKNPAAAKSVDSENPAATSAKGKATAKRPCTPTRDIVESSTPPLSPSKRQNVECHYDTSELMNPRKRQRSLDGPIERSFEAEDLAAC